MKEALSPYAKLVDDQRQMTPDWYTFFTELVRTAPLAPCTVAELPSAIKNQGVRGFVTDATSSTFHAIAVGSGSNKVPVISDGIGWRIG